MSTRARAATTSSPPRFTWRRWTGSSSGCCRRWRNCNARWRRRLEAFRDILKIGRTHLQDATPITLGQEFSGYASQIAHGLVRLRQTQVSLGELPLGGTAVGTGLNTHPEFARRTIQRLAEETKLPLREAPNHFEAQAARDACVETGGVLKTVAVSLIKIANDIRWLGSGPRLGLGELKLPALQPGSSIMPGKVNPVLCEMVIQVGAQVFGNETVVALAGASGNFELNAMMPVLAYNLLQAIELLANASRVFARRCVRRAGGGRLALPEQRRAQPGDGHRPGSGDRLRQGGADR